jgi:hypothetical protein
VARSYASSAVSSWQRERTSGTGDLPKLTPELIAELDAARAADAAAIPSGHPDLDIEQRPDPRADVATGTPEPGPARQDIPTGQTSALDSVLTELPQAPAEPPTVSGPAPALSGRPVRTGPPREQTRPDMVRTSPPRSEPRLEPRPDTPTEKQNRLSTWIFVLGAVVGLMVSVDTSWRFFGERLGVSDIRERIAMFAGMEVVLVACGVAMFEGVRHRGAPGPARWLAWALCGASAYGAIELSGPFLGAARVMFGPVLSVVALHFALGVELRARHARRTGTLARITREMRERFLSRFGLANDERDALTRTRDRAARRAAWLALAPRWTPMRQSRLDRALRKSNAAHDPAARDRMLAELAAIRHADGLRTLTQPSPWTAS